MPDANAFIEENGPHFGSKESAETHDSDMWLHGFQYSTSYVREEKMASWLDGAAGPVAQDPEENALKNLGMLNVTGYDLCEYLRDWMKDRNFVTQSVCELILTESQFEHLRKYVGPATVFWSHMQKEGFLGKDGTLAMMNRAFREHADELPPTSACFFWCDYFCLRQLVKDFQTKQVVDLIGKIGSLVSSFDAAMEYIKRSFCLVEVYGAINGNCKYVCQTQQDCRAVRAKLDAEPVKAEMATSRFEDDKKRIDSYIESTVGFMELNKRVDETLRLKTPWSYQEGRA